MKMKADLWSRLSGVLLAPCLFACGASPAPAAGGGAAPPELGRAAQGLTATDWSVYAPEVAAPPLPLRLSVSTNFAERQDVLVDLLDATGWYAGARVTIAAGQQWNDVTLDIPSTVRDPASAYLSIKVLPVGGAWHTYLDQKNIRVIWPVATPIPGPLHFGGSLKAWDHAFSSPVGNHGSQTSEVGLAADTAPERVGPFQGAYAIQTFSTTYGLFFTNFGLDLRTGEVYRRAIDRTGPSDQDQIVRRAAPERSEDLAAYAEIFEGLRKGVHYDGSFNQGVEWPQLEEADAYLTNASAGLYARFGERLARAFDDGGPQHIEAGGAITVGISYGAAADRDLLVDLLVDGRWIVGTRMPIARGGGTVFPALQIPGDLAPGGQAIIAVKIVPSGQPWTARTAELIIPATLDARQ